jgi:hypothetical protein
VDDDPGGELGVEAPRLCAVGALLAADLGLSAALRIDAGFRYDVIGDIDAAELRAWAASSGLDEQELAMIQPRYRPRPPPVEAGGRPTPQAIRRAVAQRLTQVNACVHTRLGARDAPRS